MIADMEEQENKAQYEVIARNVVGVAFAGKLASPVSLP